MPARRPAEESLLFDLPLDERPVDEPAADDGDGPEQAALPLAVGTAPAADEDGESEPAAPPQPAAPAARRRPVWRQRVIAGLTDLGTCLAVLALLVAALSAMGVEPAAELLPGLVVFLLAFSFLYQVLPLAFWGRTPGMALTGLRATARDGRQLTFGQTARRWLGSVLTVALAGLPLLLLFTGRSLSDRLSGSQTGRDPRTG